MGNADRRWDVEILIGLCSTGGKGQLYYSSSSIYHCGVDVPIDVSMKSILLDFVVLVYQFEYFLAAPVLI
ncbi:hypothetical protein EYC84_004461 [Monilinia fructicola]|uniref:Uncharacterized protein n=1 Tax=Monilinia fructicola TaxID=38448 RepID=A0A5M9K4A5_MONFR|nr:hypothetical protein EYC84_004461 [Monilinia fructicola]